MSSQSGESVGYQIRYESKTSKRTKLTLMTTGILLRKLQVEGDLPSVNYIFVDEVLCAIF